MKYFVVMGVSGCGKSTVAAGLARQLGAQMIEADALHGADNLAKMRAGEPLTDEDRWPWLARVGLAMKRSGTPVFVSCSALRRVYRQRLLVSAKAPIGFIHLHTDQSVIGERVSQRADHFMPVSLLDSQMQLLEPLSDDEMGIVVNINQAIERVVGDAMSYVKACTG